MLWMENLSTNRDEVPALGIVEACMKRKDEVTSVELIESTLLIKDRTGGDFSAGLGELFDGFESIQVMRPLLSYKVNGRICSRTQAAQDLIIIKARGAVGRLSIDGDGGSLKNRSVSSEAILNLTGQKCPRLTSVEGARL